MDRRFKAIDRRVSMEERWGGWPGMQGTGGATGVVDLEALRSC
jgi:hypothetical protein